LKKSRQRALIIVSAVKQKNVRQKNKEWVWSSLFFCLTFFCLGVLDGRIDDPIIAT